MSKYIFLSIFILFQFTNCKSKKESDPFNELLQSSNIDGGYFTNSYLGIGITIPIEWKQLSKREVDSLSKSGINLVKEQSKNERIKNMNPNNQYNSFTILNTFKFDLNENRTINPSVLIKVLTDSVYCKDALSCAELFAGTFEETGVYTNIIEPEITHINGLKVVFFSADLAIDGYIVGSQNFYLLDKKGFVPTIVLTFMNEETKIEVESIISTLKPI